MFKNKFSTIYKNILIFIRLGLALVMLAGMSLAAIPALAAAGQGSGAEVNDLNSPSQSVYAEFAKLTAADGEAQDYFSQSLAISGDTAVVGAWGDDDNGTSSGSVYIYERNQGGIDGWGLVTKLSTFGDPYDDFGWSVAINGDTVLVGAIFDDDIAHAAGSVYVFDRNQGGPEAWGLVTKLFAEDASSNDLFGNSVAIHGDTAVIGAPCNDDRGSNSGSTYIFERNQGGENNWGQVIKLTALDGASQDFFGISVAIRSDIALVGAYGNDSRDINAGSAYLFSRNQGGANNWGQINKLTAFDGDFGDGFGRSVALDSDTVLIGAYGDDTTGSAYLFERNQGGADQWGYVVKLIASDGAIEDMFGYSVAIHGDTALVGALYDDDMGAESGSAYTFSRDQGGLNTWGQVSKLTSSDGEAGDFFSFPVALDGDIVLVGAQNDDDNGENSGAAYIFTLSDPEVNSLDDTVGVFYSAKNRFGLSNSNEASSADLDFTFATDIIGGLPIIGDWNGDGMDSVGVYDPVNGEFHLRNSNNGGSADLSFFFAQDITNGLPIAGDWDGDGIDTIGVFDRANGEFRIRNSNSDGLADITFSHKKLIGALPIAGDWDGDGVDTLGIYINGKIFMRNANSMGKPDIKFTFGSAGLKPITGDWDGDGVDTVGVYDPSTAEFQLRNSNSDGSYDLLFQFGSGWMGLLPIAGNWNGS